MGCFHFRQGFFFGDVFYVFHAVYSLQFSDDFLYVRIIGRLFYIYDEIDFFVEAPQRVLRDEIDSEDHIEDKENGRCHENSGYGKDFISPDIFKTERKTSRNEFQR